MILIHKKLRISIQVIKHIRTSLQAGISLSETINHLSQEKSLLQKDYIDIKKKLEQGDTFLSILSNKLPSFLCLHLTKYTQSINLTLLLKELEHYLEQKHCYINNLNKQLAYPFLLTIGLIVCSSIIITTTLPMIESYNTNQTLSHSNWITVLYHAWQIIKKNSLIIITITAMIVTLLRNTIKHSAIKVVQTLFFPFSLADILTLITIQLNQGLSINTIMTSITGNDQFDRFKYHYKQTSNLSKSLTLAFQLSDIETMIIKKGESTGKLTSCLSELSEIIRENESNRLKKITATIPIITLIIISIIITSLMWIVFQPLLQTINTI